MIALGIFTGTWNDLLGPLIYLNDYKKFTMQLFIAMFAPTGDMNIPPNTIMAISAITLFPILIVFYLGQNYFIQGAVISGLKG